MLIALLGVLLQGAPPAPPPSAAIVVTRSPGSDARVAAFASSIAGALSSRDIPLAGPPATFAERLAERGEAPTRCEGDRACLAALARRMNLAVLITLEAALVLDEYALRVEALDAQTGRVLAGHTTSGTAPVLDKRLPGELGPLAYSLSTHLAQLEAAERKPPSDEPAAERPTSRARLLLGAGAATSGAAALVLGGLGLSQKATLDQMAAAGQPYPVTRAQAEATARGANLQLNAALVGAALAVGLGVAAGFASSGEAQ